MKIKLNKGDALFLKADKDTAEKMHTRCVLQTMSKGTLKTSMGNFDESVIMPLGADPVMALQLLEDHELLKGEQLSAETAEKINESIDSYLRDNEVRCTIKKDYVATERVKDCLVYTIKRFESIDEFVFAAIEHYDQKSRQ